MHNAYQARISIRTTVGMQKLKGLTKIRNLFESLGLENSFDRNQIFHSSLYLVMP